MWLKIEVYCGVYFLGSFYMEADSRNDIVRELNSRYGKNNWTKFNIGN